MTTVTPAHEHCPDCNDRGWLIIESGLHGHQIQACDCGRLADDDVAAARAQRMVTTHDELLDLVYICLPYMEDAQKDPAYKKGAVAPLVKRIHKAITAAEGKK